MVDALINMATEIYTTDPSFRIWDKRKLGVVISRRKVENTIFVSDKNYNLNKIRQIIPQKIQWTDCVVQNIDLVTWNYRYDIHQTWMLTQETFPFRICDIDIPKYRKGFVYMLISIHRQTHKDIEQIIFP